MKPGARVQVSCWKNPSLKGENSGKVLNDGAQTLPIKKKLEEIVNRKEIDKFLLCSTLILSLY